MRCSTISSGADCERRSLVVIDGAPGLEKAVAALWPDMAVQRCSVLKHRNVLAHAPERLHEENLERLPRHDLRRDSRRGRDTAQGVHTQIAPQMTRRRRQPGGSRRQAVHIHAVPAEPMEIDPNLERAIERLHEEFKRRIKTPDRAALRRNRRHAVLGAARPQGRSPCARSTDGRPSPRNQTIRSLTSPHDRDDGLMSPGRRAKHSQFQHKSRRDHRLWVNRLILFASMVPSCEDKPRRSRRRRPGCGAGTVPSDHACVSAAYQQ